MPPLAMPSGQLHQAAKTHFRSTPTAMKRGEWTAKKDRASSFDRGTQKTMAHGMLWKADAQTKGERDADKRQANAGGRRRGRAAHHAGPGATDDSPGQNAGG